MNFILYQIKQIRSGGIPVLRRKIGAFPSWFSIWFGTAKYVSRISYYVYKFEVAIEPDWAKAHERLGDALLGLNRFEEGIGHWRKAISLQRNDRYVQLYQRSVILLNRGQSDVMMDILRMGIEAQDEFASLHQLDKLGIHFLREWTYAIGHIALLDIYIKMGILGWRHTNRSIVLDAKPANRCYLDYWRRYLPAQITDPKSVELLTPLAIRLEDHLHMVTFADGRKMYHMAAAATVQQRWEAEGRGPLLSLTELDKERGWNCLKHLGVPSNAWFVGLHVRDDGLGNNRDADINTYRLAIESITRRGGWVIRMGNPSMAPLSSMPQVIDYAHSDARSDWMDVFLWASCRFYIGTRSGPAYVPPTFGVPVVMTNLFPIAMPFPYQNIGIYKLYWVEKEKRYMSFGEAYASHVELAETKKYVASLGIRPVDNTPDEINDIVLEMLELLDGTVKYSIEDEQLQERFKKIRPNFKNEVGINVGRVGREFLRKWVHLL